MTAPVQSEHELVQRVYDRIAAAATDEQLQAELLRYLAPVINKLNSTDAAVRNTIVEMLGHVNRRIKDHHHIQLPVEGLLVQFSAPSASAFVVNFSLVYIKMGFPRLDVNKQVELLPLLLQSIENKPQHHQDSLLSLLLPTLGHVKGSGGSGVPHSSVPALPACPLALLREKPALAKLLLDYMQDILLLPYGATPATQQQLLLRHQQRQEQIERQAQHQQQQQQRDGAGGEDEDVEDEEPTDPDSMPVPGVPAGMSISSFCRAMSDQPLKPEDLEKLKLTVVKFLNTEVLTPSSMAVAVIIASSDTRFSVANAAESLLRRLDTTIKWDTSPVISAMYILFLGTLTPIERGPVERFKNPANTRIRLKLMPCFLKSREAPNYAPLAVKVFCECIWGSYANSRLKQQGISFLHHVSFSASTEKLKPVGSMLFSGVVKVIDEEKADSKLTSLAYGALAKLSLKLPNLLLSHTSHELHYLNTLMDALTHEVGDVLLAIQEALSMVAPVCRQLSPASQEQLCIMLSEHVQNDNLALRRTVVHYAASVFPQTHFASRFILLLATGDSQDDIRLEATKELYRPLREERDAGGGRDSSSHSPNAPAPRHITPGFRAMLEYVIQRIDATPRSRWRDVANTAVPYPLKVMEELLLYLQHCLAVQAGGAATTTTTGSSTGPSIAATTATDTGGAVASFRKGSLMWPDCASIGRFLRQELQEEGGTAAADSYRRYLGLCEMTATAWSVPALEAMVRLVAVAPASLAFLYYVPIARVEWIRRFLIRGGHAGQVAAVLYGVVVGQIPDLTELETCVRSLSYSNPELRLDSRQCCALATGHSLACARHRLQADQDVVMEDNWAFYEEAVRRMVYDLVNLETGLQSALVVAVGEVARYAPLPVEVGDLTAVQEGDASSSKQQDSSKRDEVSSSDTAAAKEEVTSSSSVSALGGRVSKSASTTHSVKKPPTLVNVFAVLRNVYENGKLSSKVREQAIQTAGYLCVGQPGTPLRPVLLRSLLALADDSAELEIHFSVGGALADCVLGAESASARDLWTEPDPGEAAPFPAKAAAATPAGVETVEAEMHEKDADEMMEKDEKLLHGQTSSSSPVVDDTEAMDTDVAGGTEAGAGAGGGKLEEGSLAWLLEELLNKYVPMTKPSVRQASCLWLLTVLKRCRHKPDVQRRLASIQSAFMSLLGDTNELVQDAASKGLCEVYECCGEDTRRTMVEALVHTLTQGTKGVTNVTSDTRLFREGELGSAVPAGGQLSTYRELCSLASDLNQPDLVYKFMHLANHNAVWNSRKGAAFGFGSLAAQAGAQLEPYLPDIVPKLYRYQHDPTPRIQQPMAHIWSCLVQDTHKTTEKYYSAILSDLLSSLTSSLWRVRESACGALSDLIRQHSAVPAVPSLPALWTSLFRVRDDIKESVRLAANKTLQTLSKSCIKVCEAGGSESQLVLECVLPVLLSQGITSSVAEVRSVSLDAVVKVCRSGGAMIRPHLGNLVPALLEAISGLEHQSLSYTSVRTTTEDDRDRIDSVRVAAARGTPMMDTLNYVLQYVDEQVMDAVVAGVVEILKRSVGLTSRTAAAHVVETLTHTCPGPLEKHAGKILTALVNGLNDRNATIRKVFANAIGTVIKVAKSSSVEKLMNKLQTWYLEKEEDSVRMSAGFTLRSMHRQSGDIMRDHACLALPLAFLAMHAHKTPEEDPTRTDVWEEIWHDNTPGTEAGLRLYLEEILQVCEKAVLSNNWAMKSQSGRTLAALANKIGPSLTDQQTSVLIQLLINSLQGRTWTGKESLILALSTVAVNTKSVLSKYLSRDGELLIDDAVQLLVREANKEKKEYKVHAVRALTVVLEEYQLDRFEVVYDICSPHILQCTDTTTSSTASTSTTPDDAVSAQERPEEQALRWLLLDELLSSLGRAWPQPNRKDTQEHYSVRFVELLNTSVSKVPRKTQLTVISALGKYWERHYLLRDTSSDRSRTDDAGALNQTSSGSNDVTTVTVGTNNTSVTMDTISSSDVNSATLENAAMERGGDVEGRSHDKSMPLYDPLQETLFDPVIQQSCKIFNYCLGISKYYSLRKQALTVLLDVVSRTKGNPAILAKVSAQVAAAVAEARRDAQPDIQALAADIHRILLGAG